MREIKFRAKRLDNNEWAYGFIYRHDPPLHCFGKDPKESPAFAIIKTGFADWNMPRPIEQHEVNGETVGQSTGLINKHEQEVWEGDIIEAWVIGTVEERPRIEIFRVVFKVGSFCAINERRSISLSKLCKIKPLNKYYECRVIGNIYENPELLKPNSNE